MKLHNTTRHHTPEQNPTESIHPKIQLKAVLVNGHTESEPLYDDVGVQASTITAAKNRGFDKGFVHMVKTVCLLALSRFKPGDKVDSPMLCADIRYGLRKNKPLDGAAVPGLSKGERLNAGTVVLILADAGELPLEPLGTNTANLQQYRLKQPFGK